MTVDREAAPPHFLGEIADQRRILCPYSAAQAAPDHVGKRAQHAFDRHRMANLRPLAGSVERIFLAQGKHAAEAGPPSKPVSPFIGYNPGIHP